MTLNSQNALVTGATSGLGMALAKELSRQGVSLLLTGRNAAELARLAKELPSPVKTLCLDLSIPSERSQLLNAIEQSNLDLVINNAGFGLYGQAVDLGIEEQMQMIQVNISAVTEITLTAAKHWKKQGQKGTILNVCSAAAYFSIPLFAVYAASKAYVLNFSKAVDDELYMTNIRILSICPGQINTHFRLRASKGFPQQKDHWTISCEKAVRLIISQIKKKKQNQIIDWRYAVAIRIASLLPQSFLKNHFRKQLSQRINLNQQ